MHLLPDQVNEEDRHGRYSHDEQQRIYQVVAKGSNSPHDDGGKKKGRQTRGGDHAVGGGLRVLQIDGVHLLRPL